MTPGEYVIKQFGNGDWGGATEIAEALKLDATTVYRWAPWPRHKPVHNLSGAIPSKWYEPLLRLARKKGVELTHAHLIEGAAAEKKNGH